jgi:ComF family protein
MLGIISDFFNLFFPKVCPACTNLLVKNENILCTKCLFDLPKTNLHKVTNNEVEKLFWGRCKVEYATSFLYFNKKGIAQALMHQIKYKGNKDLGLYMGKLLGYELKDSNFNEIDLIIPVPLHFKRLRQRGYNQSELIAAGISEVLKKPVDTHSLKRKTKTSSQTKKNRYERWLNVNEVFEVAKPESVANKHILLIDDVVTTGATLESCTQALLACTNVKVSIATLAKA